jgi:2-keto-4-pentenoate hydratase/2-oxohepta-3-ene-1,7-dioic acid hydratase in catechol pathway
MARPIVRFSTGNITQWGILVGAPPTTPEDSVTVAPLALEAATTAELLANLPDHWPTGPALRITAERLLSPITSDAQIVCQGLNYRSHAEESSHSMRRRNLFFAKAASSLTGAFAPVRRPSNVELLDYEVEIGLVIRKRIAKRTLIDAQNIGEYVAGVVLANDVSARDTMFGAPLLQWYQGKSARGFCPCGPALLLFTSEECAAALENLRIELSVNGEGRQAAETSQLIFPPAVSLSELSAWLDLSPGDLLLTGTPGGVTASASPRFISALRDQLFDDETRIKEIREELGRGRPFLRPGDTMTASLRHAQSGQLLSAHLSRIVGPECVQTP